MQLSVNQDALSKALSIVGRAVATRTTMPILGNVFLEATGSSLRLSATNRELSINCYIEANVKYDGSITVPARLFSEFVGNLPQERVKLDLYEKTLTLKIECGSHKAQFKGVDAFEFPSVPTSLDGASYTMNAAELQRIVKLVGFCASQDEKRPTLNGVQMSFNGQLTTASLDGYRLSVHSAAVKGQDATILVPVCNLAELGKLDPDNDVKITISNNNQVLFSSGGIDIISSLIDGKFPDYNPIVPKEWTTKIAVSTAELQKAAKVAYLFARDSANKIGLSVDGGLMRLDAEHPEMGSNISTVDCKVEGPPLSMMVNAKYLIEALNQVEAPLITMEMTTDKRPIMLRTVGNDNWFHVIMPMVTF